MSVDAVPLYKKISVETSAAIVTGAGSIMYILLVGHANACDLQLHDRATNNNEIIEVHSPKEDIRILNLQEVGGIPFETGLYAEISGVGAHAWVWVA